MRTRKPYSRKKKPNPIAKNLNKFNKPSVVPDKHKEGIEKDRNKVDGYKSRKITRVAEEE